MEAVQAIEAGRDSPPSDQGKVQRFKHIPSYLRVPTLFLSSVIDVVEDRLGRALPPLSFRKPGLRCPRFTRARIRSISRSPWLIG
jgi:hypothetical protein